MIKKTLFLLTLFLSGGVFAQVTDTIYVGYTKSAYLLFKDSTIKYDVGSEELIVRHAGNKIILQAEVEDFEETNLMVECKGTIYMYIVRYQSNPTKYLYNYTVTTANEVSIAPVKDEKKDSIKINHDNYCEQLLSKADRISNRGVVKYKISIYLRDLAIINDNIYMEFEIVNNGNIPYIIDFYRYKVRGVKKRIKGESFQVVDVLPLYEYKRPVRVEGKSSYKYVIVMDKFVLTENKKMVVEHWEDNGRDLNIEGGRKIDFDLFYKDILNISKL